MIARNLIMKNSKTQAFTLVELITVVIVIGVLSAIIFPKYEKYREKTIDKQAPIILKAIWAAERNYMMRNGDYYPKSGQVNIIDLINDNLGLELVDDEVWVPIEIQNTLGGFEARLERDKGGYNRRWDIDQDLENATCNYLSGVNNWCPN